MKHSFALEENKIWRSLLFMAALSTLLLVFLGGRASSGSPVSAFAAASGAIPQAPPRRPWTAVGSAGAVDDNSLNRYAFATAPLVFKPAPAGPLLSARS